MEKKIDGAVKWTKMKKKRRSSVDVDAGVSVGVDVDVDVEGGGDVVVYDVVVGRDDIHEVCAGYVVFFSKMTLIVWLVS